MVAAALRILRALGSRDGWIRFVEKHDSPALFAVALHSAIAMLAALGQIDRILQAMHPAGVASYGMGSLSGSPFSPPKDPYPVGEVAKAWVGGGEPGFTEPATLAAVYVGIDLLFIFAYCWVLAVLLARLSNWLSNAASTRLLDTRMASGRAIGIALVAVLLLAVADMVEGVLQGVVAADCLDATEPGDCATGLLSCLLYVVTPLKWVLFAGVAGTIAFGFLALASQNRDEVRELGRVLGRLRASLAVVVLLGVAYLVQGDQAADLLRRWDDDEQQAFYAVLVTLVLAGVLVVCGRGLVTDDRPAGAKRLSRKWFGAVAGVALVIGGFAWWVWPGGPGLLALGGLLAALALANAVTGKVSDDRPAAPPTFGASAIPALLGAAPIIVLGLALQGAALGEVAWASQTQYVDWLCIGVALQVIGAAAYHVFASRAYAGASVGIASLAGGVVVGVIALSTWSEPWGLAHDVGGVGVISAFAIALTLIGYGFGHLGEVTTPPRVLRLVGFRRAPFVLLLALWGVAAAMLDTGGFHDARRLGTQDGREPRAGVSLQTAFDRWRQAQGLPTPDDDAARRRPARTATPLVLVSASGGGIRAAYWTASTLDCLFGSQPNAPCAGGEREHTRVLAASGVSGGSLGVTAWRTHERTPGTETWVDTLKADVLTPTLAWGLFVDLPNSLLHLGSLPDRAEVLERSWERAWLDEAGDAASLDARSPLAKGLFATGRQPPLLMLNGTAVETGCRFNVSVLNANVDQKRQGSQAVEDCLSVRAFEPETQPDTAGIEAAREKWALGASVDVNEFVCQGTDLRLSTAVLLSARFPYVSPSGRLTSCGSDPEASTHLVDGGYFDSSAAETSAQLWAALEPIVEHYNERAKQCVMPFAIQIDNGYDEPPGPDPAMRPLESIAPLQTVLGSRAARQADARQMLALAVSKPVGRIAHVSRAGDAPHGRAVEQRRYAHIYPRAHPGTQAPLGWALSKSTQEDLSRQLHTGANAKAIKVVRDTWLQPNRLRCERRTTNVP